MRNTNRKERQDTREVRKEALCGFCDLFAPLAVKNNRI